jgi:hypothetical protein
MKMDLLSFDGQLQIEGFLDWLAVVERFFDYMEIPEDKKVKLVAYRLMGGASAWWEQLQLTRIRQRKGMVQTWAKMRRLLRARYLSPDYEHQIMNRPCFNSIRIANKETEQCKHMLKNSTDYPHVIICQKLMRNKSAGLLVVYV